jgi:undecaprenyl-phosphate 4-deoxy-4-formamido-L-arabinose transferase
MSAGFVPTGVRSVLRVGARRLTRDSMPAGKHALRTDGGARVGLSIVIPLYRDEDALKAIFTRCEPILRESAGGRRARPGRRRRPRPRDGACGRDGRRLLASGRLVRLARNFGQHPAVFTGLEHSRGDLVVSLRGTATCSTPRRHPEARRRGVGRIPRRLRYRADRHDPLLRRWITRGLTRWLNARTGTELRDFGSMFRLYQCETVELMLQFTERHRYVPAVVPWLGVPIKEVAISHQARSEQGSRYRLSTLFDLLLHPLVAETVWGKAQSKLRLTCASMVGAMPPGCARAHVAWPWGRAG